MSLCVCVRVGEACLGTSEVRVAGNECSLNGHHEEAFLPEKFLPCTCSYIRMLEQPSGLGVGHELARAARSCTCCSKLTHKGHVCIYDNALGR